MLQPIKATTATQATQATEASEPSESIKPISEQRPGQTLRDRLMQPVDATSKKTTSTAEAKTVSQYQQYSMAKYLPATPISSVARPSSSSSDDSAITTSNFQNAFNKYSNYNDYWSNLIETSKLPAEKMEVWYGPSGEPKWMSESEANIRRQYSGIGDLDKFVSSQMDLEKRLNNRFYSGDITKKYSYEDFFSPKGGIYDVLNIGNKDRYLSSSELESLYSVAKDQGLGQSGYESLLEQAVTAKGMYATKNSIDQYTAALSDPNFSDWETVSRNLGVEDSSMTIEGIKKELDDSSQISEIVKYGGIVGAGAGLTANVLGNLMNFASAPASAFVPVAAAMQVINVVSDLASRTMEKARFNPIKNGKIATSIEDFSGSEKQHIKDIAEQSGKSPDEIVSAISAAFYSRMSKLAYYRAKDYDTMYANIGSDNRLEYSGDKIKQTNWYVRGVSNALTPEMRGSYDSIFGR